MPAMGPCRTARNQPKHDSQDGQEPGSDWCKPQQRFSISRRSFQAATCEASGITGSSALMDVNPAIDQITPGNKRIRMKKRPMPTARHAPAEASIRWAVTWRYLAFIALANLTWEFARKPALYRLAIRERGRDRLQRSALYLRRHHDRGRVFARQPWWLADPAPAAQSSSPRRWSVSSTPPFRLANG